MKKNKKSNAIFRRIRRFFISLDIIALSILPVFAEETPKAVIVDTLYKMSEDGIDGNTSPFFVWNITRSLGWLLIRLLAMIMDHVYNALSYSLNILDFAKSTQLRNYIDSYDWLLQAVLILAIVFYGVHLLVSNSDKPQGVFSNIFICVLVLVAVPTISTKLIDFTQKATTQALTETWSVESFGGMIYTSPSTPYTVQDNDSLSDVFIGSYMVDLKVVDNNIKDYSKSSAAPWRKSVYRTKLVTDDIGSNNRKRRTEKVITSSAPAGLTDYVSDIKGGKWKKINITETMPYQTMTIPGFSALAASSWLLGLSDESEKLNHADLWGSALSEPQRGKNSDIKSLAEHNILKSLNTEYYRWQCYSWSGLILSMLLITIVLCFAVVKIIRLCIDVAINQVILPFIALTDLSEGRRTKEVLKNFVSLLACILLCIILLGLFFVGLIWIQANVNNTFIRILAMLALTWATIDGPDVIQQILGVDVGVKSGYKMAVGTYGAVKTAGAVGSALKSMASTGKKGVTGIAKSPAKAYQGIFGKKTGTAIPGEKPGQAAKDNTRYGGLFGTGGVKDKASSGAEKVKESVLGEKDKPTGDRQLGIPGMVNRLDKNKEDKKSSVAINKPSQEQPANPSGSGIKNAGHKEKQNALNNNSNIKSGSVSNNRPPQTSTLRNDPKKKDK